MNKDEPANINDTLISNALRSFKHREKIRNSKHFRDFIYRWNHGRYNSKEQVGPLMSLTQAYSTACGGLESMSREEWAEYYFQHGRTPRQVLKVVEQMGQNEGLLFTDALLYWWIHIMDGAYQGELNELHNMAILETYANTKDYSVRRATPYEDRTLGVDAVVTDQWGRCVIGVQIKVASYFASTRETVVHAREVVNPQKYARFEREYNAPVWYMVAEDSQKAGKPIWVKPAKRI